MPHTPSAKTTIKDVAAHAKVSIKTVSRVINKETSISDATREKVLVSIRQLNYVPDMTARGLAGSHSFKIALLVDLKQTHVNFHYIIQIQSGVLESCRNEGHDLLIHPCDFRSPTLAEDLVSLARASRLTGIILMPPLADNLRLTKILESEGIPFVTISSVLKRRSIANVICQDDEAAGNMASHLLSLGHTKIAIIKGHPDHGASDIRFKGFVKALHKAGIKITDDYMQQGYFDFESGKACTATLLSLKTPPTAIFACNDEMAAGAIHQALKQNVKVPEELSVTGFDDSLIARQTWPTLTTVRQPISIMALKASQLLIEAGRYSNRKREGQKPQLVTLDHEIVIRNSTAAPIKS